MIECSLAVNFEQIAMVDDGQVSNTGGMACYLTETSAAIRVNALLRSAFGRN